MNKAYPKLSEEDRRAIDLLLDQGSGPERKPFHKSVQAVSPKRLAAAEKLLKTLGTLSSVEAPPNLAARTMALVDRDAGRAVEPLGLNAGAQAPPA